MQQRRIAPKHAFPGRGVVEGNACSGSPTNSPLVELIDNPRHRRSKLVRLTPRGKARYRELAARLLAMTSTLGSGSSEADIAKAAEVVRLLSEEVKGGSERLG